MDDKKDNPGVKFPPPLVFLLILLVGYGLNKLSPLPIGVPYWGRYVGIALEVLSSMGIIYMFWIFNSNKTEIEPWKTTSNIITRGPYKYSRNPIYLIFCGITIGLGILTNSYWILFSFIPSLTIVYFIAVKKEERYLEKKFGQEYLDYKLKVRRWL